MRNWSLASPHCEYNRPTSPWTSDGPTCSNGWARGGTYLDMVGKQYKKDQEWEKKGVKNGF